MSATGTANSGAAEKEKSGRRWTPEAETDLLWTLVITSGASSSSQNWNFVQEAMEKLGHEFNANGIRQFAQKKVRAHEDHLKELNVTIDPALFPAAGAKRKRPAPKQVELGENGKPKKRTYKKAAAAANEDEEVVTPPTPSTPVSQKKRANKKSAKKAATRPESGDEAQEKVDEKLPATPSTPGGEM